VDKYHDILYLLRCGCFRFYFSA